MAQQTTIISLGGSMIAPDSPDVEFLRQFHKTIVAWLDEDASRRVVLIAGGGGPARTYQKAYRSLTSSPDEKAQDWIGIAATRLNAELVKSLFGTLCPEPVVTDPTAPFEWSGRVLVAAGWKPGFSTDFDAVMLAERFGARSVVNLSNIVQVYTSDPKVDPQARPLDTVSWPEFQAIVGTEWRPGINAPFDPIATRRAAELGLSVAVASGSNLPNLNRLLRGLSFVGTLIR